MLVKVAPAPSTVAIPALPGNPASTPTLQVTAPPLVICSVPVPWEPTENWPLLVQWEPRPSTAIAPLFLVLKPTAAAPTFNDPPVVIESVPPSTIVSPA